MPLRRRSSKACDICHRRKIKCDFTSERLQPCSNCQLGGHLCRPHERKRPKYLSSSYAGSRPQPIGHGTTIPDDSTTVIGPTIDDNESLDESTQSSGNAGQVHSPGQFAITPQIARPGTGTSFATFSEASRPTTLPVPEYVATTESHVGRSDYLGDGDVRFREEMAQVRSDPSRLCDTDFELLQVQKAFEMPQRSVRASLIDTYMKYCTPWMPILEPGFVEKLQSNERSPLLLNAIFLAGSRVSSSKTLSTLAEDFYRKARLLFMLGHEIDTLTSITAVTLLQWYNPTGPEHISTSTSGFWVRIAAGMAYQFGLHREPIVQKDKSLRRRLWWAIVCRDDIISVGTGRPRTIDFADSDVAPPTIRDFPVQDAQAHLFVAFSGIIRLLADLTENIRRKTLTRMVRTNLENALYRWVRDLPTELRLFHGSPKKLAAYNFEARQVLVPYFVTICILTRHEAWRRESVSASFIASSFVAGIFEDFLNRDELCHCGPVFTFYALAAGLAQIPALQYSSLASTAEESLSTIRSSLTDLKGRWGSAVGALAALAEMKRLTQQHPTVGNVPEQQSQDFMPFFDVFGPELCKQHFLLEQGFTTPGSLRSHTANLGPVDFMRSRPEHDLESSVSMLHQSQGFDLQSLSGNDADPMLGGPRNLFFSDLDPSGSWMDDLGLGFTTY